MVNLDPGAAVQFIVSYSVDGQTNMNVFHYNTMGPIMDWFANAPSIAGEFETVVVNKMTANMSSNAAQFQITVQVVNPIRTRPVVIQAVPDQGQVSGDCLPAYCAVVLARTAELAGRRYQGRVFIGGIPSSYETASRLNLVGRAAMDLIVETMTESIIPASPDVELKPIIWSANYAAERTFVADARTTTVMRVQRRREVGRGI